MGVISRWKNGIVTFTVAHEAQITALLLIIALILLLVACFGKPGHKAAAMLYIVL